MRQKRDFLHSIKKNKAGEVTVLRHKSGFRTLNVTGRVEIPSFLSDYPYVLQRIITEVGTLFLGLFPFLDKRKERNICTYSLPETMVKKKDRIDLTYDFLYAISAADNIPSNIILESVLQKNRVIGEQILDKLDKRMKDIYKDGG